MAFAASVSVAAFSFSQSTMTIDGSADLSEYSISVGSGAYFPVSVKVTNTSNTEKEWTVQRVRVEEVASWTDGLCWGPDPDPGFEGLCFGAGQMTTNPWTAPNAVTVPAGGKAALKADLTPADPDHGTARYRYIIFEGATAVDSIDIVVSKIASLNDLHQELGVKVAPNPANDVVNFTFEGTQEGSYQVTDLAGKVVATADFSGTSTSLNVSSYKNGIYYVTLTSNDGAMTRQKIVVRH